MIDRRQLGWRRLAAASALLILLAVGCAPGASSAQEDFATQRKDMVEQQIAGRGVHDTRVLQAMRDVPRHKFVPSAQARLAYADTPLPIGHGQTISQPYMVGYMTELLAVPADARVLEVGTGSGYQAAVLSRLVSQVYSIELIPELAASARIVLGELGYSNVQVRAGDGYQGWPDAAPFDAIIVTAAPEEVPEALVRQLKRGGRLVVPVGESSETQHLLLIEKSRDSDDITTRTTLPVRFVPMVHPADRN